MMGDHAVNRPVESAAVLDRPESRGFWNVVWPLAMLAAITAMIVQSCLPRIAPLPAFDAASATQIANEKALVALSALKPDATLADALPVLNLIVMNFASGSVTVPSDAEPVLKLSAQVISALPADTRILVVGHTDNVGSAQANETLSLKRAESVRAALVALGVNAERLQFAGAGDAKPVAANTTEQGRFADRRIEFLESKRD